MTEKLIGTTGVIELPDEQAMVQLGGSIARLIRDRLIITLQVKE